MVIHMFRKVFLTGDNDRNFACVYLLIFSSMPPLFVHFVRAAYFFEHLIKSYEFLVITKSGFIGRVSGLDKNLISDQVFLFEPVDLLNQPIEWLLMGSDGDEYHSN
jgi:hypothetical protein